MNDSTDDELLSAYLDGELSGEELLRAERLLAERPECRQLVDELRNRRRLAAPAQALRWMRSSPNACSAAPNVKCWPRLRPTNPRRASARAMSRVPPSRWTTALHGTAGVGP